MPSKAIVERFSGFADVYDEYRPKPPTLARNKSVVTSIAPLPALSIWDAGPVLLPFCGRARRKR